MTTRIDETNLNIVDKNAYLRQKDEMEVAVKAIEILENIARSIRQAGGAAGIEDVANSSVKELAIIAARNSIKFETTYTGPPTTDSALPAERV